MELLPETSHTYCNTLKTKNEQNIQVHIQELQDEISTYNKKIKNNKEQIILFKRKLYLECHHLFKRDHSAMSDDIYKYQCIKCSLYRGEF